MQEIYRIIEALLIIHNFLECIGDDPTTIAGFNGEEDDDVDAVLEEVFGAHNDNRVEFNDDDLHRMGMLRRKVLLDLMTE